MAMATLERTSKATDEAHPVAEGEHEGFYVSEPQIGRSFMFHTSAKGTIVTSPVKEVRRSKGGPTEFDTKHSTYRLTLTRLKSEGRS